MDLLSETIYLEYFKLPLLSEKLLTRPKLRVLDISFNTFPSFWVKTKNDLPLCSSKAPSPSAKPINQDNQLSSCENSDRKRDK